MKQSITKEQWDELEPVHLKAVWDKKFFGKIDSGNQRFLSTIGQLIEFLGDDLKSIAWEKEDIVMEINDGKDDNIDTGVKGLCNILWEAVKYKLRG